MNQKAKDFIKANTLNLQDKNRMDSTGYVQYAVSAAKAYGAIMMAEEALKGKCIESFKKNCPCWSRFEKDRKCDECAYLKDFVDNMEEV